MVAMHIIVAVTGGGFLAVKGWIFIVTFLFQGKRCAFWWQWWGNGSGGRDRGYTCSPDPSHSHQTPQAWPHDDGGGRIREVGVSDESYMCSSPYTRPRLVAASSNKLSPSQCSPLWRRRWNGMSMENQSGQLELVSTCYMFMHTVDGSSLSCRPEDFQMKELLPAEGKMVGWLLWCLSDYTMAGVLSSTIL